MLQQVVNMRHDCHHSWVKAPLDVDVFIGKEKVVHVRYIPERVMNVVNMQTLSEVVTQELNAYAASVPLSPASVAHFLQSEFLRKVSVRRPFPWYCFYTDKSAPTNDQRGAPPPLLSSSVHCHLSF